MAGYFTSASLMFGTITLTNIDPVDVFYTKYTPAGNVLWAKKAGAMGSGASNVNCKSITTDNTGHFYITGWFNGSLIDFNGNGITNTNAATYDGFYAKYDTLPR